MEGSARIKEMEKSLSEMLKNGKCLPDIYTMNSFICAYGSSGRIKKMESFYEKFQHMDIEPDVQTFNILIKSYGKSGMYEKMMSVMQFMKKRFYSPTTITFNIIIECFGRAGKIEMEYFFRLMKYQGVKPNSITCCSVVSGYSKAGLLEKVSALNRQTENTDIVLDTTFFNCVISAYGQVEQVEIMREMFLLMKEKICKPDNTTFATMKQAYRSLGMDESTQQLEIEMREIGNNFLEISSC